MPLVQCTVTAQMVYRDFGAKMHGLGIPEDLKVFMSLGSAPVI